MNNNFALEELDSKTWTPTRAVYDLILLDDIFTREEKMKFIKKMPDLEMSCIKKGFCVYEKMLL